ncbi:MAG: DUF1887 family protein [Anaerolineae bacterium]|nr:DUF1887 family protein [Anaerolineae bacterium]
MLLISLVGEQPIPNVLPFWQYPGRYHLAQFAATERTLPIAQALATTIAEDPALGNMEVLPPLVLDAYDLQGCRRHIAKTISEVENRGEAIAINLTGGTKIMVMGAMLAAFGTTMPLMYISTECSEIIHYHSDGTEKFRDPFQVSVSIEQYLKAHGFEVSNNSAFNPHLGQYQGVDKIGDTLELRVERLLKESGYFDDVRRGVHIRRQGKQGPVVNELDVVAIKNGVLAICSCKSGKNVTKEMIYELDSLSSRENMGIYCGKVMCFDHAELTSGFKARTQVEGVKLVYGEKINVIADVMLSTIEPAAGRSG